MCKKQILWSLGLGFSLVLQLAMTGPAAAQVKSFNGRVAYSADGNFHDRDDIGASPMALAILEHAGMKNKLVHFGYNSHIWETDAAQKRDHTTSVMGARERFGYNGSVFFDVDANPARAYEDLATEINKSSADNPLYILVAGPYEHVCQSIKRSQDSKRRFVTVINHGDSNPFHQHNGSCTAEQTAKLGIKYVDIVNQNGDRKSDKGFNNPYIYWEWLKNHKNADLRWIYSRMKVAFAGKADISDTGMMWYMVTGGPSKGGQQTGNAEDLRNFFGGNDTSKNDDEGKTPVGGACSVTAPSKIAAQQKYRSTCGRQWADCDKKKSGGGYICSSKKMN